jgi:hypothetical protein
MLLLKLLLLELEHLLLEVSLLLVLPLLLHDLLAYRFKIVLLLLWRHVLHLLVQTLN